MAKQPGRPSDTRERLEAVWAEVVTDPNDRPTVKELAQRVGTATSTLYYRYPEWVDKIQARRYGKGSGKKSPSSARREQWKGETEAARLIEDLRKRVRRLETDLAKVSEERDRLRGRLDQVAQVSETNMLLRGVLVQFSTALRRHVDGKTAQIILDEATRIQERALKGVIPVKPGENEPG